MDNIIIDEEFIQTEAENTLERKLTPSECEQVYYAILEDLSCLIQDKIDDTIRFNEMLKRNRDASKTFPHYKTYHRNENAYQLKFKVVGVFKSEEDAREFIHHDFITEFDEWRLVVVNDDNTEHDVYKIHC
jgi:hypothetical protein